MRALLSLNIGASICLALVSLALLQGCVSSSLEDAAPQRATTSNLPSTLKPLGGAPTQNVIDNTQSQALSTDVPVKYDKQGFPTFAETPRGEVEQLSPQEKIAIETKVTELLLSRSNDENVRAGFEAKLKRLRELAKTHEQNADAIISQ